MKIKDLLEQEGIEPSATPQQHVIKGDIIIPQNSETLIGYKHSVGRSRHDTMMGYGIKGIPIAGASVNGDFFCISTQIKSLEGCPSHVDGDFYIYSNPHLKSLHNIHKMVKYVGGEMIIPNTVKSNIMGLAFIKVLKPIKFHVGTPKQDQVMDIINKHLLGDRDLHACQEEMLEAGFRAYAKL